MISYNSISVPVKGVMHQICVQEDVIHERIAGFGCSMLTVRTSVLHCFDQGEAADTRRRSRS